MATIDPSIALGVRPPQIENPINALARVMEIQGLQQQTQLGQMKMDEYRRGIEDQNALRAELSAPDADPYKVLLKRGKIKEATDYLKGKVDVGKTEAETRAKQIETVKRQVDLAGQAFGYVRANPTVENAMAVLDSLERQGIYQPDQVAQMRQMVQQNPQNVAGLADQAFRMALDAKEQLAKFQTNNIGGQTITQGIDPVTGKATLVSAVQNTQSPDSIASNARIAADNALSRQVTMRGQNMTDQRQRDQNDIESGKKTQQGVMDLRKEFNALPEVKNYREVVPIITSVQRAPDTPAGDIDLIYGVGKVMDPNSVVREGEMAIVIKSGSPAQRLQGYVNYVQGGGRLTPSQRQELVTIMRSRAEALKANYDNARKTYETHADRQGLPKDQIFIDNELPAAPPVDFGTLPTGKPQSRPSGRGNAPTKPRELQWGQ